MHRFIYCFCLFITQASATLEPFECVCRLYPTAAKQLHPDSFIGTFQKAVSRRNSISVGGIACTIIPNQTLTNLCVIKEEAIPNNKTRDIKICTRKGTPRPTRCHLSSAIAIPQPRRLPDQYPSTTKEAPSLLHSSAFSDNDNSDDDSLNNDIFGDDSPNDDIFGEWSAQEDIAPPYAQYKENKYVLTLQSYEQRNNLSQDDQTFYTAPNSFDEYETAPNSLIE